MYTIGLLEGLQTRGRRASDSTSCSTPSSAQTSQACAWYIISAIHIHIHIYIYTYIYTYIYNMLTWRPPNSGSESEWFQVMLDPFF